MVGLDLVVNFLSLFIPAIVGVGGSFWLYLQRQQNRESNLRSAFVAELEGTEFLKRWPLEGRTIPAFHFVSVSVYEGNTGRLALLSESETAALVRYYTQAKTVHDALRFHTDIIASSQSSPLNTGTKSSDREDAIRGMIDDLELFRQRALLTLRTSGSESELPTEGDSLESYHDSLRQIRPLLVDYGFLDCQGEKCVFTASGERFFAGDLLLTGREKVDDVLERDKSRFRRTWERRYSLLRSALSRLFN